jgi:hypothetical protein
VGEPAMMDNAPLVLDFDADLRTILGEPDNWYLSVEAAATLARVMEQRRDKQEGQEWAQWLSYRQGRLLA